MQINSVINVKNVKPTSLYQLHTTQRCCTGTMAQWYTGTARSRTFAQTTHVRDTRRSEERDVTTRHTPVSLLSCISDSNVSMRHLTWSLYWQPRYENVCGTGGKAPRILNTAIRQSAALGASDGNPSRAHCACLQTPRHS